MRQQPAEEEAVAQRGEAAEPRVLPGEWDAAGQRVWIVLEGSPPSLALS